MHLEDRGLSRKFFWFLWIMYASVYMTRSCFTAAMATMVSDGVIQKNQTGIITSVFYVIYGILQLAGGVIADRYNPERIIKIGLVGAALANLFIFLFNDFHTMLIAWSFNAVFQFALWPCVFKIISSKLVRSDRKMMIFYISYAVMAGLFMSYLVAIFVTKWQYNFAVSSAVLAILAIVMHFMHKMIEPKMIPNSDENNSDSQKQTETGQSTIKIFALSGFFIMCIAVFSRVVIDNGIKTLSPTMFMESYEFISPKIANSLTLIIVLSSLLGMFLVRLIYPKYIRNELVVHLVIVFIAIPFAIVIKFIGNVSMHWAILSMCVLSALFTAMRIVVYNFNARFAKFGKDGRAAAISNMAESFAVMAESYGFTYIAQYFGWSYVTGLCLCIIIIVIPVNALAILFWKRFKNQSESVGL